MAQSHDETHHDRMSRCYHPQNNHQDGTFWKVLVTLSNLKRETPHYVTCHSTNLSWALRIALPVPPDFGWNQTICGCQEKSESDIR